MWSSRKQLLLSNLSLAGPVWLASDIHLGPDNPKTAKAFFDFLDLASAQAGALFLLGDVFNVWIGDDCLANPSKWLEDVVTQLQRTSAHIPIYLMHGNRDFLMGQQLCAEIGAIGLAEQCILTVGRQKILLAHGDEFCTTDRSYQRFRRVVRNYWVQKLFLGLSLERRQNIAARARAHSIQSQATRNHVFHDVYLPRIAAELQTHEISTVIHGHTHRPGHFVERVADVDIERWVLPDWEFDHLVAPDPSRGGWICVSAQSIDAHHWR
jgi:UDP-2,3-diacylglucosamine hydrolase